LGTLLQQWHSSHPGGSGQERHWNPIMYDILEGT
jgi:hypothetical protein